MTLFNNARWTLSLIQSLTALFISFLVLMIGITIVNNKGLQEVERHFTTLSDRALPLSSANAKLTQSLLEQTKQLSFSTQSSSEKQLAAIEAKIRQLIHYSQQQRKEVFDISHNFNQAISESQKILLRDSLDKLNRHTMSVIATQRKLLAMQVGIDADVAAFRYGLSSIGPEMNRISSFLSLDNPESTDAANRFIASASSMEGTFLMLMMQTDLTKAEQEYKEMRNRIAGINLAYDDFVQWHPDIAEFASLTAPYDMVNTGFRDDGVLKEILAKLELVKQQNKQTAQAQALALQIIDTLNQISSSAESLIAKSQSVVKNTISSLSNTLLLACSVSAVVIVTLWIVLRRWLKGGLKQVLEQLNRVSEQDFRQRVNQQGPDEIQQVSARLNRLIDTTSESLNSVTSNCEILYQTAQLSHDAADSSNHSLEAQNHALTEMVTTITQLEASIKEIATVTNESHDESKIAEQYSTQGVVAIEDNRVRLKALEQTLDTNEQSMIALDSRVKRICEMVDLISGIAENTNLLALNAAIEAARAGEQGRGFAVVADEVRKLARDTSDQTTNIRHNMNELVAAADQSRRAVEGTRKEMVSALESSQQVKSAFNDIEHSVGLIRSRFEQISVATEQQQRATAEVSRAITQVSHQGDDTKTQLEAMLENAQQVAQIAKNQQQMLHKYRLR
ncbi:methyl-accepting chemotaxis protein [Vibrio scophthalmi]|uniref:methyl-accepting chemotaxis protein n=1 Tax=Vibrio scophthalmi TaxID=45658 RepID=UPI0038739D94